MKKVLFIAVSLVAATALSAGFLSCSKKSSAKKVSLTVWESLDGPDEFIRQAGDAYTATHPNVEINFVNVELGDAAGQIALDGPGGVGPDLFAAPHDKLGELVNGGHVLPTANAETVKKNVIASCSKALTYNGVMYGYPVSAETYALFYNRAYISDNDVPKTWEALGKWATDFNKANKGKYGFVMNVGDAYYTIVFTTGKGNRLFGPNGDDETQTNINSETSVNGMKFFQSMRSSLNVPAADLNTAVCDAAFQAGNAAMHITGPWNIKNFSDAGLDFGVAPLPALPGDTNPSASFSGTRAMFVSAYSNHSEEAADFAQFLLTPEMQQLRFKLTKGPMPAIDTKVDSPYMGGFLKQLEYAFPMPSIPKMASYWEAMNNASKNIWNGADVKTELDACNAAILN